MRAYLIYDVVCVSLHGRCYGSGVATLLTSILFAKPYELTIVFLVHLNRKRCLTMAAKEWRG